VGAGQLTILFIQNDLLQRPQVRIIIDLALDLLRNMPARPGEQQVARVLNASAVRDLYHLLDCLLVATLLKCKLRVVLRNLLEV
jgi:hypothetical protein